MVYGSSTKSSEHEFERSDERSKYAVNERPDHPLNNGNDHNLVKLLKHFNWSKKNCAQTSMMLREVGEEMKQCANTVRKNSPYSKLLCIMQKSANYGIFNVPTV